MNSDSESEFSHSEGEGDGSNRWSKSPRAMLVAMREQPLGAPVGLQGSRGLVLSPHDTGEGEDDSTDRATSPVAEAQIETWLATAAEEEAAGRDDEGRGSSLGVLEEQEESETDSGDSDYSEYSYEYYDDDEYDDGYEEDLLLGTPASMAPGFSPPPTLTPMQQPVANWPDLPITAGAPTPSPAQAAAQAKNTYFDPVHAQSVSNSYVDPILAQIQASQTTDTVEVFQQPTDRELKKDGVWMLGRRVSLDMYGAGTVVAFNKKLGFGASSHEIQFDRDGEGAPRTVKLQRKTNTDPEKVPWRMSLDDSAAADDKEEPFVAPVDFGHEDFVHDWSLTPHAATFPDFALD